MGQNFALNVASKGFTISVCNRSHGKVDTCVARAKKEDLSDKVTGFKDPKEFIASIQKPRRVMFLVKAGPTVDKVIDLLSEHMEQGDILIDGGNEWYENSVRRSKALESKGIDYVAMGVSGGEEGARNGPSLMPGCSKKAYDLCKDVFEATAAKVDGSNCVAYVFIFPRLEENHRNQTTRIKPTDTWD